MNACYARKWHSKFHPLMAHASLHNKHHFDDCGQVRPCNNSEIDDNQKPYHSVNARLFFYS